MALVPSGSLHVMAGLRSIHIPGEGGVLTMTQGLAKGVRRQGIRVNALSPGLIDTPLPRTVPAAMCGTT